VDSLQLEGTNTAMMPGGQAEMCSDEGIPSNNHDSGYMETKNTMHKMCSKQVTMRTSMSQGAGQMSRLPLMHQEHCDMASYSGRPPELSRVRPRQEER